MNRRLLYIGGILAFLVVVMACGIVETLPEMDGVEPTDAPLSTPAATIVSEPPDSLPADLDALDRALFAELRLLYRVFAESGDEIWDGLYQPDQWPLLFVRVDPAGRPAYGYLLNAPNPPADAVPLSPNPEGFPPVYRVTEGLDAFADPEMYFDTAYPLGDLALLAVRYNAGEETPEDPQWLPYVVHEGFHRYQESWGETGEWDQEVDYPLTAENLALTLLEHHVLLAGLDAPDGEAREYLRFFAAVRAERMSRYPAVRVLDNPQEWSEGTADYVERRFTALASIEDMYSLRESLAEPLEVEADWVRETFTWDRFYASGDAVCILMDRAGIDWRPAAEAGKTLYDIVAAAVSLSEAERAELLARAQERFDYPALLARAEEWAD